MSPGDDEAVEIGVADGAAGVVVEEAVLQGAEAAHDVVVAVADGDVMNLFAADDALVRVARARTARPLVSCWKGRVTHGEWCFSGGTSRYE